ncbi:MAG: multiheme c-type cytochrome [Anaerolineae bacterium]
MKMVFAQLRGHKSGWLAVMTPLLIAVVILVLTETTQAAPPLLSAPSPSSQLAFQQAQPTCQSCHPQEYADWQRTPHAQAALDPIFKEQFNKSHNQGDCLKCHTTGFNKDDGKFTWEGVTCEACHGPYKQGHPAAETMQLPMESSTCRVCHQAAFQEWEKSKHAQKNIECFDCHKSHTQGLRTGRAETLCAACHNDQQTQFAHSLHGIGGVECGNCHMAPTPKNTAGGTATTGAQIEAKSHTFVVPADVCNRCHSNTIHPAAGATQPVALTRTIRPAAPATNTAREAELEAQITELQGRLTALRDAAVISMGLSLGFGGFVGLLLGIAGMSLWHRSRSK